MKRVFVLAFCCLFVNLISAQEVMDVLTEKTCDCLKKKDFEGADRSKVELELGICFIEAGAAHLDEIKEETGLDITDGGEGSRELGEKLGIKLATSCPTFVSLLSVFMEDDMANGETSGSGGSMEGKLLSINSGEFASLTIKENGSSREYKVYWFHYFDNSEDLINKSKKYIGKQVVVQFEEVEMYLPKIQDYGMVKVISALDFE